MTAGPSCGSGGRDNRLRKKEILRGRRNFERLFGEGRWYRHPSGLLTVVSLPNGLPFSRFCFGVGRRHGKSHDRNYLRRVLREIVRTGRGEIPVGMDYCLIPSGPRFRDLRFDGKRRVVLESLRAAGCPSV